MAYATLEQVRRYLRANSQQALPAGDDELLSDLIVEAQAIIDVLADRTFEATADTTRYFDARRNVDGLSLMFDCFYAASITSIVNGDGQTLAPSDYITTPAQQPPFYGVKLLFSSGTVWTWDTTPENAIAVTGKWAYTRNADGTAQADIRHWTIRLTAWLYLQRNSGVDIDRPIVTSAGVTIMPGSLPTDIVQGVGIYRSLI